MKMKTQKNKNEGRQGIIYHFVIFYYCLVREKTVMSNLLKTLLVSRGLFKSGMSSLTVRVVVDEDEFISTKQTPAPAGESIKSITLFGDCAR